MMELLAPSFTKKVPAIEVTTQAAPMTSGKSINVKAVSPVKNSGGQDHRRDHGHDIGLEQVGRHARAVADIVAVHCRRWWPGLRGSSSGMPASHLADEIAADIGTPW